MPKLDVTLSQVCKLSPMAVVELLNQVRRHPSWTKECKDTDLKWVYTWKVGIRSLSFEDFLNGDEGTGKYPNDLMLTASKSYIKISLKIPPENAPQIIADYPEGIPDAIKKQIDTV